MKIKILISNGAETEFAAIVFALLRGYFRGRTITERQSNGEVVMEVL